jgi:hypothetical protein
MVQEEAAGSKAEVMNMERPVGICLHPGAWSVCSMVSQSRKAHRAASRTLLMTPGGPEMHSPGQVLRLSSRVETRRRGFKHPCLLHREPMIHLLDGGHWGQRAKNRKVARHGGHACGSPFVILGRNSMREGFIKTKYP